MMIVMEFSLKVPLQTIPANWWLYSQVLTFCWFLYIIVSCEMWLATCIWQDSECFIESKQEALQMQRGCATSHKYWILHLKRLGK